MDTETIERKYAFIKLGGGDWLLPSNDGRTIYRLYKYEDGPSLGLVDWDRDRELWGVFLWDAPPEALAAMTDAEESPWTGRWRCIGNRDTRREAVQAALEDSGRA